MFVLFLRATRHSRSTTRPSKPQRDFDAVADLRQRLGRDADTAAEAGLRPRAMPRVLDDAIDLGGTTAIDNSS